MIISILIILIVMGLLAYLCDVPYRIMHRVRVYRHGTIDAMLIELRHIDRGRHRRGECTKTY